MNYKSWPDLKSRMTHADRVIIPAGAGVTDRGHLWGHKLFLCKLIPIFIKRINPLIRSFRGSIYKSDCIA